MPATNIAKSKAKQFLNKLLDSLDSDKHEQSTTPPKPPPKPNPSSSAPNLVPNQGLVQSFNALSLTNTKQYYSDPNYIGDFNPSYSLPPNARPFTFGVPPPISGSFPRPPAMPTSYTPQNGQQSLTMQMALLPPGERGPFLYPQTPPSRPHSASVLPTPHFKLSPAGTPVPGPAHPKPISTATPTKPKRRRATSTPLTSSDRPTTTQCAGVTKAGKRCTRQVKSGPALAQAFSDIGDDDTTIERFCFQHTKELLGPSGYYARKNGQWIKFEDWIPNYLQPDTQVALRVEMEKSRAQSDVPGYIYTFEIRDPDTTDTIKLKVGRAVNLVKRIDQWGKQCGSKEQVLRGWYPGTVEPNENWDESSLMKGRINAGEKGAWCHRLERLIHLELADLAATCIYLDPAWPTPRGPASQTGTRVTGFPCPDCGSIHKEIFEFTRWKRGRFKSKEWEHVVKPVIERWGKFVDNFV